MSEKLYTNARQSKHIFASILNISVMDPLELYLNKWQLAFSISWMYQPKDQILHMCLAGCVFWFDFIWRVFCACMFLDVIFLHVFVWSETLLLKLRNLPTFTDIIINNSPVKDHSHLSKKVVAMKMLKSQFCPVSILQCYSYLKFQLERLKTSDSVRIIKNDQVVLKRYSVSLCAIKCCFNNARCNFSIALISSSFLLVFPKLQLHFLVS